MSSTLVIIPTYNELHAIGEAIERTLLAVPTTRVLVVDDNSPDGTGRLADEIAAKDDRVSVLHRTEKNGLGAAYKAGFAWAEEHDVDFVIEMDADGSHQPEELPLMIAQLEAGADLSIGARWIPGGKTRNWPYYRKLISRGGTFYARILLKSRLHDITSGFRGFRADTLRAIDLDSVGGQGYVFQIEMAWLVEKSGGDVREFPITFVERVQGTSKMSSTIVVEALTKVTSWGLAERFGRSRDVGEFSRRPGVGGISSK
ncbi:polyprenol monophosphomannose synthase [Agreia sp. COWG]|uniref:polyprenol monophosphomannose synthase n=1 Tax=Agreia sp. COWG TaxID=2773266 RepID=UPI0019275901|nr:polyprenol monophosphomannose synthase [Agreia sp. COWG]CAD5992706.1 Undecaprenyl-phosphate mannosyltransferase [Agreia sp. COWG]